MINELVVIRNTYRNAANEYVSVLGKIIAEYNDDNSILVEIWEFLDKPVQNTVFPKTSDSIFYSGIISKCFYDEVLRYNLTGDIKGMNPLKCMNAIVCCDENYGIGSSGDMLFHIKEDLNRFKSLTLGGAVIMGRKTRDSLPKGYLPGRTNIILTRDESVPPIQQIDETTRILTFNSSSKIISHMILHKLPMENIWVIGGEEIYNLFLDYTSDLYLTMVNTKMTDVDTHIYNPCEKGFVQENCSEVFQLYDGLTYQYKKYIK